MEAYRDRKCHSLRKQLLRKGEHLFEKCGAVGFIAVTVAFEDGEFVIQQSHSANLDFLFLNSKFMHFIMPNFETALKQAIPSSRGIANVSSEPRSLFTPKVKKSRDATSKSWHRAKKRVEDIAQKMDSHAIPFMFFAINGSKKSICQSHPRSMVDCEEWTLMTNNFDKILLGFDRYVRIFSKITNPISS